jgi:adenylate cyclase class 2
MIEVEQKYHVTGVDALAASLEGLGARHVSTQTHVDTYFNHPCRDFADSREALRLRRVDGVPMVTYKGQPAAGGIKAREELEWRLDPGDPDGSRTETLWKRLDFRQVASVRKVRRTFEMPPPWSSFAVVIDRVDSLGDFAEIELIVDRPEEIEQARDRIGDLADQLKLSRAEPRSYLTLLLESDESAG